MKWLKSACFLWLVLGMTMVAHAMAPPRAKLTLVVIPERYSVVQVAMDLEQYRSVVLITYRGDASSEDRPVLHAWNGTVWIPVTYESFSEASFLKVLPQRAVLVGDEELLPPALVEAVSWCPQVWQIPSVQSDHLVNSLGKIFAFRQSEWEWFSGRYNLNLEDVNQSLREDSWYFHPYIEDTAVVTPLPTVEPVPSAGISLDPAPAAVMEIQDLEMEEADSDDASRLRISPPLPEPVEDVSGE